MVLRNGAGDDVGRGGIFAQSNDNIAYRILPAMREEAFFYDDVGVFGKFGFGVAVRGVDALNLFEQQFGGAVFGEEEARGGVENLLCARASAVVLFDVRNVGVFTDMKTVNSVMNRVVGAAVIDAATGDDSNVHVVANEKIVIDSFFESAGADDDGNMNNFALGVRLNINVDAAVATGFGRNVDIGDTVAADRFAIDAEVVGAGRDTIDVGDILE